MHVINSVLSSLLASSILFLAITTVRPQLQKTETSRSSTVSITENHVLKGCGIHKQRSYDFLLCAHLCLARSGCPSVNYENVINGMCELNRLPSLSNVMNISAFIARPGYSFGQLVIKYIFTTLGARGAYGPTSTAGYQGTSLEEQVIVNKGIQIWTVPVTGSYVIEAVGASGGNGSYRFVFSALGSLGAKTTGTFQLNQGTKLKILVGQEGSAGGARDNFTNGDPGQATRNGSRCGGTQGGGGKVCNAKTGQEDFSLYAGGGAGIRGNGSVLFSYQQALAPYSFITGGTGGQLVFSTGGLGEGSFGSILLGGGGGGYSGGRVLGTYEKAGTAGGGGSYIVGKHQQNVAGANKGDSKVVITLVNP